MNKAFKSTGIGSHHQKYSNSIFIWIDILGFAEALENESKYFELSEILKKFRSVFNNTFYFDVRIISDGVLLIFKDNLNFRDFVDALNHIGEMQLNFIIDYGYFIRGAISVGTDFDRNDEECFVSNGLARAVKLEGKSIGWPIIGTNLNNMKQLQNFFSVTDDSEYLSLKSYLNHKCEHAYFIDFLKHIQDENQKQRLSELISKKLNEFENNPSITSKYIWLLKYFKIEMHDESIVIPASLNGVII